MSFDSLLEPSKILQAQLVSSQQSPASGLTSMRLPTILGEVMSDQVTKHHRGVKNRVTITSACSASGLAVSKRWHKLLWTSHIVSPRLLRIKTLQAVSCTVLLIGQVTAVGRMSCRLECISPPPGQSGIILGFSPKAVPKAVVFFSLLYLASFSQCGVCNRHGRNIAFQWSGQRRPAWIHVASDLPGMCGASWRVSPAPRVPTS